MTITEAENFSNGPARLNISIEQEADFQLPPFQLLVNGIPYDLTSVTVEAWITLTWNPPLTVKIPLTVTIIDAVNGYLTVGLTAAQTTEVLAQQPTASYPGLAGAPAIAPLGGWVLYTTDATYGKNRLLYGAVELNRDPSQ